MSVSWTPLRPSVTLRQEGMRCHMKLSSVQTKVHRDNGQLAAHMGMELTHTCDCINKTRVLVENDGDSTLGWGDEGKVLLCHRCTHGLPFNLQPTLYC